MHPLARSRWGVVVLAIFAMFAPLSIDLYLPALPEIGRDLAAPGSDLQLTLTAFLAGLALGMPIYGPISDAIGRRPIILFGAAVFIVASLLCAVADNAPTLVAFRFLQALGGGASAMVARVIVRDIFSPERQARMLSLVALVTALTPLAAPLLGGQLLALAGWRSTFLTLAAYGAFAWLLAWFAAPESHPPEKRGGLRLGAAFFAYGAILRRKSMWGCIACAGGSFAAMFAYIAGTPFIYIEYFGVSPQWYGALFGLNIVSQMLGTWLNARLVGRYGPEFLSHWGALAGLGGGVALLAAGTTGTFGLWGVAAALLPIIGVTVMLAANSTALAMGMFPQNAGAAAGLLAALMFASGALSSYAVSLAHTGDPQGMCQVIFVCCALSAAGAFAVRRGGKST